jgi:hypothetical protein
MSSSISSASSSIGTKFAVGTTATNASTDAYINVNLVESYGTIGDTTDIATFSDVAEGIEKYFKTIKKGAPISMTLANDFTSPGQARLREAYASPFNYNFRVDLPDSAPATTAIVTISVATPGVVTLNAHGFTVDTQVQFTTSGTLPTGLLPATTYFVRNPTANTFELSLTRGGTVSIATTGTPAGTHSVTSIPTGTVLYYKGLVTGVPLNIGTAADLLKRDLTIQSQTGSLVTVARAPN